MTLKPMPGVTNTVTITQSVLTNKQKYVVWFWDNGDTNSFHIDAHSFSEALEMASERVDNIVGLYPIWLAQRWEM